MRSKPQAGRYAGRMAVLALGLALFTATALSRPAMGASGDARVAVEGFAFTPPTITIPAGGSVVWAVRKDPEQHTVTPTTAGSFAGSGPLFDGDDYTVRFDTPGRYDYVCSFHPFMTGSVIVGPAATAGSIATPGPIATAGSTPGPSATASPSSTPGPIGTASSTPAPSATAGPIATTGPIATASSTPGPIATAGPIQTPSASGPSSSTGASDPAGDRAPEPPTFAVVVILVALLGAIGVALVLRGRRAR